GTSGEKLRERLERALPEARVELGIPVRTRYVDDALTRIVTEHGPRQVVILGAGMDTRAFRLGLTSDVVVFEVDRLELLVLQHQRLQKLGAQPTCTRHIVGADLRQAGTRQSIERVGFTPSQPTIWVLEGLIAYFEPAQVDRLVNEITESS